MQLFFNSLFAFQATGFYVLSALFIIFLFILIENEKEGTLFILTSIYAFITSYSTGFSITFDYIATHKFIVLNWFVGYVFIGIAWAFCKVYFKARKYRNDVQEYQKTYVYKPEKYGSKEEQFKSHIYENIARKYNSSVADFVTTGSSKSTIIMWMAYWPFSAFWTLLDDPIKHLFILIYNCVSRFYRKIHIKAVGLILPE